MSEEQKPEPRYLTIEAITVTEDGGMAEFILSDGSILSGVVDGAFQEDAAVHDETKMTADVLDLRLVGKFELRGETVADKPPEVDMGKVEMKSQILAPRPNRIHVPRSKPLIGPDGNPVAS